MITSVSEKRLKKNGVVREGRWTHYVLHDEPDKVDGEDINENVRLELSTHPRHSNLMIELVESNEAGVVHRINIAISPDKLLAAIRKIHQ